MENFIRFKAVQRCLLALTLALTLDLAAPAAESTNSLISADLGARPATNAPNFTNAIADLEQRQLRTYLKLQERLHSALLAIEQTREESSQESRTNAEALTARLALLEHSLVEQREQQVQSLHASNRTLLLVAGCIVGLGLIALAFTAFQHSRGMNRLAEIATGLSQDRAMLNATLPPAIGPGDRLLLAGGVGTASGANQNLLTTIDRLEHRIQELENTAQLSLPLAIPVSANGHGTPHRPLNGRAETPASDHASVLIGKGQVMLSLGQAEDALACFDQAIAAAPEHAEAHLKRGMALDRLQRWSEAVTSCERAIALNPGLTQAYLCKGGIFNRQERYKEALACYEQALRSESKT